MVLMVANIRITIFWDVRPCCLVYMNHWFVCVYAVKYADFRPSFVHACIQHIYLFKRLLIIFKAFLNPLLVCWAYHSFSRAMLAIICWVLLHFLSFCGSTMHTPIRHCHTFPFTWTQILWSIFSSSNPYKTEMMLGEEEIYLLI